MEIIGKAHKFILRYTITCTEFYGAVAIAM